MAWSGNGFAYSLAKQGVGRFFDLMGLSPCNSLVFYFFVCVLVVALGIFLLYQL